MRIKITNHGAKHEHHAADCDWDHFGGIRGVVDEAALGAGKLRTPTGEVRKAEGPPNPLSNISLVNR